MISDLCSGENNPMLDCGMRSKMGKVMPCAERTSRRFGYRTGKLCRKMMFDAPGAIGW